MVIDTDMPVRVRMAPSPTGTLHVGGARTALFNWLFARHHGGVFVLRIEDTDQARSKQEYLDNILWSVRWLGLDWDEGPEVGGPYGPYCQMERLERYREATAKLLANGQAYHCYCSTEELEAARQQAREAKLPFRYRGRCRQLRAHQKGELEAAGRVPVVRFATPEDGGTSFDDIIHGPISIANSELDEFVIVKSDGIPTYNFAVVVDDSDMAISHVIRGDEHIANTPKQLLLQEALGLTAPKYAHAPLVLGMDRAKLSKRCGAASVSDFASLGYLPEALRNYLVLLGWAYDDKRELFSLEELVQCFDLDRVGNTGGAFNMEKLDWMNGHYIRQTSAEAVLEQSLPFLRQAGLAEPAGMSADARSYWLSIMPLVQERQKRLSELPGLVDFFFAVELQYDALLLVPKGLDKRATMGALTAALEALDFPGEFAVLPLEEAMRSLAERLELKTAQLFGALRVAVTGRTIAPPLFQTMSVLGRERTLNRLRAAIAKLSQVSDQG